MRDIFSRFLDFIFPHTCAGCGRTGTLLCAPCIDRISPASPSPHTFIHALFDYRSPTIKRAIWRFKYGHARGFAKAFAPYLYDQILGTLSDELFLPQGGNIILAPIPLHPKRLHERGYNQSDLLVREIIALDTAHIFSYAPDILVRVRATKPQARSEKRKARLENLRDAFAANKTVSAAGKTVILIDDVTTTGATLLEARRALSLYRPRKVLAVTVGH